MKSFLAQCRVHNEKLALIAALLTLPWLWMVFVLPLWMSAIGLLLGAAAFMVLVQIVLPSPGAPRRVTDKPDVPSEKFKKMRRIDAERLSGMSETMSGLRTQITQWSDATETSHADLKYVQDEVGDVIRQTEEAVINIGKGFSAITKKTAQQMDFAMRLIKTDKPAQENGNAIAAWLTLPDYIKEYEMQLNRITKRMMSFSDASQLINEQQSQIRRDTNLVDELLDELRAMAKRTGKLALDSSVIASSGSSNQREVVGLTDEIRAISEGTHELTRRIRQSLDAIKGQVGLTHKAMRTSAEEAATAAEDARVEMRKLNSTMMDKTRDIENSFEKINVLGKEIQGDINKIIIAMQFQDITQQKLERLKQPVLNSVIGNLRSIADESTHAISRVSAVLESESVAERPFHIVREGATAPDAPGVSTTTVSLGGAPATAATAATGKAPAGNNPELF